MLTNPFLGKKPSQFQINPIVKAFIISDSFLWSGWNFITPIFAIFVTQGVAGGTMELAASAYSVHLIARVLVELISGKLLQTSTDLKKYLATILGILVLTISYLGFAQAINITQIFLFYALAGVGLGIASPAKNSLFSSHLDKNKETSEWGLYDASVFIGMAASSSLGGFVAKEYGFQNLFYLSAVITVLSVIPYLLFLNTKKAK